MACSLEVRVPFLDHRVVEFAWRLPSALKYNKQGGQQAAVAPPPVPPSAAASWSIARRRDSKSPAHVAAWSPRGRGRRNCSTSSSCGRGGFSKEPKVVRECWNQHLGGGDHWQLLWTVLMYRQWASRWASELGRRPRGGRHAPQPLATSQRGPNPPPCTPREAPATGWQSQSPFRRLVSAQPLPSTASTTGADATCSSASRGRCPRSISSLRKVSLTAPSTSAYAQERPEQHILPPVRVLAISPEQAVVAEQTAGAPSSASRTAEKSGKRSTGRKSTCQPGLPGLGHSPCVVPGAWCPARDGRSHSIPLFHLADGGRVLVAEPHPGLVVSRKRKQLVELGLRLPVPELRGSPGA